MALTLKKSAQLSHCRDMRYTQRYLFRNGTSC